MQYAKDPRHDRITRDFFLASVLPAGLFLYLLPHFKNVLRVQEDSRNTREYSKEYIRLLMGRKEDSVREASLLQLKSRLQDCQKEDEFKLTNDFYLYQWLKLGNFNVDRAETLIRSSLKWRKETGISDCSDDFPEDVFHQFPIYTDGVTLSGKPVGSMTGGPWDLKGYLNEGGRDRFVRYCALMTVQIETLWLRCNVREGQNIHDPPRNVIFIVNAIDYSFQQIGPTTTGCVVTILGNIANYFPRMVEKVIFINVSRVFLIALNIVKPFLSFLKLQIHGCDKDKWKKSLREIIEPSQLRPEFGGTLQPIQDLFGGDTSGQTILRTNG